MKPIAYIHTDLPEKIRHPKAERSCEGAEGENHI